MTKPAPILPADYLMEFILGVVTPLLMNSAFSDIHLARRAAAETVNAYNARGPNQLVTVGQIVAFALTALDNLRLSAAPDLALTMQLKLRGSANALSRSAQRGTETLEKTRPANPPPVAILTEPQYVTGSDPATQPPKSRAAEPVAINPPAKPDPAEQHNRLGWASAMKTEAENLRRPNEDVPPAQQKANRLWADVLNDVANKLKQAKTPLSGPGMSRSNLMRTTLLTSDPGFPAHFLTGRQRPATTQKRKP